MRNKLSMIKYLLVLFILMGVAVAGLTATATEKQGLSRIIFYVG